MAALFLLLLTCVRCSGLGCWAMLVAMNLRLRNSPPLDFGRRLSGAGCMCSVATPMGQPIHRRVLLSWSEHAGYCRCGGATGAAAGRRAARAAGGLCGWLDRCVDPAKLADILMSFPSLLLAVVVLYVFEPRVCQSDTGIGATRMPVYIRTTRSRCWKSASGSSSMRHGRWGRAVCVSCASISRRWYLAR